MSMNSSSLFSVAKRAFVLSSAIMAIIVIIDLSFGVLEERIYTLWYKKHEDATGRLPMTVPVMAHEDGYELVHAFEVVNKGHYVATLRALTPERLQSTQSRHDRPSKNTSAAMNLDLETHVAIDLGIFRLSEDGLVLVHQIKDLLAINATITDFGLSPGRYVMSLKIEKGDPAFRGKSVSLEVMNGCPKCI